ncbi:hypothetical protein AAFF_G00112700, partial [Aldrovandia affinis]
MAAMGDPEEKASTHSYMVDGKHFVDENQVKLIERVKLVKPILDHLLQKKMLGSEMYENIAVKKTSYEQMRCLLHNVIFPGSNEVKDEFCRILEEKESNLMRELRGLKYNQVSLQESAESGETPGARKPYQVKNKVKQNVKGKVEWTLQGHAKLEKEGNKTSLNSFFTEIYIIKGGNAGLNFIKDDQYSLRGLIDYFHPEMEGFDFENYKVLFIFDGLDESRLPLEFNSKKLCVGTEPTSVSTLLVNLIKGNLLPSALIWITSRPAASSQIHPDWIDQVTEVRGFKDPQKEEYFRKRIGDQNLAGRIISHVKSSRSLYIMCHIPIFCWIAASVLETMLGKADSEDLPTSLTHMYTCFILTLTTFFSQKYAINRGRKEAQALSEADREFILKLGELAFQQLETGNLIFYEDDLKRLDIDVSAASVQSGVCTEIFKVDVASKLREGKVFSFIHLSVQEYMAALYVFYSFSTNNTNLLDQRPVGWFTRLFKPTLFDLHKEAVDQALQSQTGHLDLFLRFLLGLSLDSNQSWLKGLLSQTRSRPQSTVKTVQYIKKKIGKGQSSEKSINLFHCLNELNDTSLVKEIQNYLSSGRIGDEELNPAQLSALVFVLLVSEEDLDEFDLSKYSRSDDGLLRLLPVLKVSKIAKLWGCKLTEGCCGALASALSSNSSHLRELNLGLNPLHDSGVKLLSAALESPHCKLEKLGLEECELTEGCCGALASALSSNSSHLRELNLSRNPLQDSGVKLLSAALESPHCKLEKL